MESPNEFDLTKDAPPLADTFDVTPMVDCAFLLLIFFMMTAKVGTNADVEQPTALNADALQNNRVVVVLAKTGPGGEALLYRGETASESNQVFGDLKTQEDQIQRYIEESVVRKPDIVGIVLKEDKRIKQKYVSLVSRAANAGGGGRR
jgi:biopolymer transport protein ExbD